MEENLVYRKAGKDDLNSIALLVTNLLGTCNIDKSNLEKVTEKEILENNKEEIKKDLCNYYVCEINNKIVGACGISNVLNNDNYKLNIGKHREILYLVVDKNYQKRGIGTNLMHACCDNHKEKIIYEAWGDEKYVNSKFLLEKLNFAKLKNLGNDYYKNNGYCIYCVNRNKNCSECNAELWIKN